MAKPTLHFLFFLVIILLPYYSNQLQFSQYQTILKIKNQLNFPQELDTWSENADFCNLNPTEILTISCYEDNITQIHVNGNLWFPQLSQGFSNEDFFANLAALPNLKVLSLVSLGLQGNLPQCIRDLSSLEMLNISSNSLNGSIPIEISFLKNLQTLVLDHNRFTGQVPESLASLTELTVLSLRNNSFDGNFPNSFSKLVNLRNLVLSSNNLTGLVPKLDELTNLQVLDLEDNNLGPDFPTLPKNLVSLVLKGNRFKSALSDELNSCFQLQKLDISMNEFFEPFSATLFSLTSLNYLNISRNKFTGKLLHNMSCNEYLKVVDLSENRLTGDLPECLKSEQRVVFYSGNCLSRKYKHQHVYAFCQSGALAVRISPHRKDEKATNGKAVLASSMVGGFVGTIAILGLALVVLKRGFGKQNLCTTPRTGSIVDKISSGYTLRLLKDARYISETMKLGALGTPPYRTFVLDELKEATNNFDTSNVIGEGSKGKVYKGWLTDGTIIAIRSLKVKKRHNIQSYTSQLELISKLRHGHLVSAIGHCFESYQNDSNFSTIFLVFEYLPNGTLRKYISDGQNGQKFIWAQRIAAAIGIARGLLFLHTGITPGVYSNHLKITNVLLDQDLHVKIGKYNIPLLAENRGLDETGVSSRGSKENVGKLLSFGEKDDVYDFGVILLEMIVGRTIISENDVNVSKDILTVSLTTDCMARRSIMDPTINKECSDDSLKTLMELCVRCLSNEPSDRPSIEDVIWNLQFAAQVQDSFNSINQESPIHLIV